MRSGVKDGETAEGYKTVILFHPTSGRIARPEKLGLFTPYEARDSTKNYALIVKMLNRFTGPVLDLENQYEGGHYNFDPDFSIWNASEIRTGTYSIIRGSTVELPQGFTYVLTAYEPVADLLRASDYYSPSVNQNVSGSWRRDVFFEGEPGHQFLVSPRGHTDVAVSAYDGTRASVETRDCYYVYTGRGDSLSVKVGNGSTRSGTASWFSLRDGKYYADSAVDVNVTDTFVDLTPPSGGGVDND
ncbi:hypothetical protein JG688_00015061 [Phytophthora aleatoria]|uniref:Uncharacterized protein n=1 Tax=Phytophthora aleatoria TaxID=2496075 RepID=A0A8J5IZX4_9STRA|nr:hypothetical protein JG688_00015061 [Phytophthora aleatoria]